MKFNIFGREIIVDKKVSVVIGIIVLGLAGLGGSYLMKNDNSITISSNENPRSGENEGIKPNPSQNSTSPSPSASQKASDEIKIQVDGCVKSPGIVTLKKGQLINDAINLAGGFTDDADKENINLVYELKENVKIRVKSKKENTAPVSDSGSKSAVVAADKSNTGVVITKDSGGAVLNSTSTQSKENIKVNINTATAEELDTLPGIGPETAKDIIAFRDKNGGFKNITDIMKITGIKDSKFNKIKDSITVD